MYEEEKIIDIKDMLYKTCNHWRSICVTGIILLICSLLIKLPSLVQFIKASQNVLFIETIIKYGGIGLIGGIIFAIFFHMISYILSNKIYLAEDLNQGYEINLIGIIPYNNTKKREKWPDYFIKKIFGIKTLNGMQELLTERAAEEITILTAIRGIERPNIPVIALVSSCSTEIIVEFEMQISKKIKGDIQLVNAGNILQDARSVRIVDSVDLVVLVEKQGKTIQKEYKETCRKLFLWKKDVLGVVLLE